MSLLKINKHTALAFQMAQAILELAFDARVMIRQATISFAEVCVAPGGKGPAFLATVHGAVRDNISFVVFCDVYRNDDEGKWYATEVRLELTESGLDLETWHMNAGIVSTKGHDTIELTYRNKT